MRHDTYHEFEKKIYLHANAPQIDGSALRGEGLRRRGVEGRATKVYMCNFFKNGVRCF